MYKGKKNTTSGTKQMKSLTLQNLKELFQGSIDVAIHEYSMGDRNNPLAIHFIYCQGLCNVRYINKIIFQELDHWSRHVTIRQPSDIDHHLPFPMFRIENPLDTDALVKLVFEGNLLLFFANLGCIYWVETAEPPKRDPEQTTTDSSVRGPRDGFTEELAVNVALIRKRIKTSLLHYEMFELGSQTNSLVGLLFMANRVDQSMLSVIRQRLSSIQVEGVMSMTQLEELLNVRPFLLLPVFEYTGRPDFASNALLHGRVVILLNGSPTCIIAPVNFTFLLNTPEDSENSILSVAFTRILRIIGVGLALFLPGFWIALVTFHQDQIPYTLIATLVISRQGVPIPASLEAFLMLFLFELFREAGLRLPTSVGQTISVVGGLIVGEAAISAGLTAPGILVIIAISVMSTFTLVNQNLVSSVVILRIIIMLICSVLGMFGFMMCLIGTLLFIANVKSFGVYYLTPISPFVRSDFAKIFFRMPWKGLFGRPKTLDQPFSKERENQ